MAKENIQIGKMPWYQCVTGLQGQNRIDPQAPIRPGLLPPVYEDFKGLIACPLNCCGDQEALAVPGNHKWGAADRPGTYSRNCEQRFGDTGFEGRAVGLHVHGKIAVAEVVKQLFAVATPSGLFSSRCGDLPFAARL